ncbi:MAG: response regulator [Gammaproteobacteria bacterium]|nr:response regulator [Gammaproteobacteria bacterium]
MIRLGISKQIIIIALFPALIVATILSIHYIWDQFDYISASLDRSGKLIAKQLSPAAEYAVYSGNIELIKPLVNTIIQNDPVLRVQIFDNNGNIILDMSKPEDTKKRDHSILENIFEKEKHVEFSEPILVAQIPVDDIENPLLEKLTDDKSIYIGKTVVTVTNRYEIEEKIEQIKHGALITLLILMLTTLIVIRISINITRPIKSLTRTVRNITSGNLDAYIELNSTGELGILESCINQMKNELKDSRTDLEIQLDVFTDELQQTLEELEIRNAELDITRSKAIYANNAKSEFLANMSHEIRTPLSGIIGFTELLQGTPLSAQQQDYSKTIHKSSIILLELINDILDLSKIESGKVEISSSEFNLVDIIEDIINLLSQTALDKNIEIFYRIEKDLPTIIQSDSFRVHQILTNLIGNAIKFTDKGYVYLQVTRGKLDNTESSIKFTVSDTGIGMSNDVKTKLFKAFTQADTSITRRFGGTGLGLVISRKLTLLMKGEIGFDSTENKGSTFWFSVPVTPILQKHKISELIGTKIAFVCNHFIAKQAFNTLFSNWQCSVNDYNLEDLDSRKAIKQINQKHDIIIVLLSNKDLNQYATSITLNKLEFSIPSFLIASTQSHTKLKNLQQETFKNAVFTSEKTEVIKQKLINILDKNSQIAITETTKNDAKSELDWSNINIMVVDDNEINLRLVEIILHKHRARVTTAHLGTQAIDYASMNLYDIIFMDLHMPGLDGYETAKKIREISPGKQSVIIALTANALPQEKEKVIESGMNGILIKPVSDAILQKVINQWVLKEPIKAPEFSNTKTNNGGKAEKDLDHEKNIFSIAIAKEFTGDNEELAYELFNMLRTELDGYKKAISIAVKNNDLKKLHEQVHKLHGASRCCGTTELKKTSSHIENLIHQNISFDIEKETRPLLIAIQNVADYKITAVPPTRHSGG